MKPLESAALLIVGSSLLTFSSLALFVVAPHPPRLANPDLLVDAMFAGGGVLLGLGLRGLCQLRRALLRMGPS